MAVPLSERPEAASFKFILEGAPPGLSEFYVCWALQLSAGILGDTWSYLRRDEEFTVYTIEDPNKLRSSLQKCFDEVGSRLRPLPEAQPRPHPIPRPTSPSPSNPLKE